MSCTNSGTSSLPDCVARTYKRKVAAIKKSVYVNIPSKIAKECAISKGSLLSVTLEGGRVILSRNNEEVLPQRTMPGTEPEQKPTDDKKANNGELLHKFEDW